MVMVTATATTTAITPIRYLLRVALSAATPHLPVQANPRIAAPYTYETPAGSVVWRRIAYAFTFSYFFWFFANHRDIIRRMVHIHLVIV